MSEISDRLTDLLMESYDKGVADAKIIAEQLIPEIVAWNEHKERQLIADWVRDMCQGLDANAIADGIENGGNDDIESFKVTK